MLLLGMLQTININDVNITLTSPYYTDWSRVESTVIDANDPNLNVVTFSSGRDSNSIIRGITLAGGNYGVYCSNSSSPVIRSCAITDNNSHGVYVLSGSPWIVNNKISENTGDGIVMLQSELDISRNFVNLYNFGRKCYENEPQEIFS